MDKRLYVLIDENLPSIYGAVQGGHAVAQWLLDNEGKRNCWRNNTLIYLVCDIKKIKSKLDRRCKRYSIWREPDMDNTITAIAIENSGHMFSKLKILE